MASGEPTTHHTVVAYLLFALGGRNLSLSFHGTVRNLFVCHRLEERSSRAVAQKWVLSFEEPRSSIIYASD